MRFLVSRLIKIFANLTKILCYVFHFLFPKKRFTISKSSGPLIHRPNKARIPKTVWLTHFTNHVSLPIYINYLFNRLMAPTFIFKFMDDADILKFVEEQYGSEVLGLYDTLTVGASKADFWRILVLQKFGGVYMDLDAHLVWPLELIIEPEFDEIFLAKKDGNFTNYFMAGEPGNKDLKKIIAQISENIRNKSSDDIYSLTGPNVLSEVLAPDDTNIIYYKYNCNQGNFTNEWFQYIDSKDGKWSSDPVA